MQCLEMTCAVHHCEQKKHQAQVTRLRRQLQEAQARKQQWIEKAEQLRGFVRQFRLKMEE